MKYLFATALAGPVMILLGQGLIATGLILMLLCAAILIATVLKKETPDAQPAAGPACSEPDGHADRPARRPYRQRAYRAAS